MQITLEVYDTYKKPKERVVLILFNQDLNFGTQGFYSIGYFRYKDGTAMYNATHWAYMPVKP